ncbi:DUF4169 family protein [Roseicyclus sp.]|uniref:DUF4169 family protein n=1 Tax=Roseicyclus sp. TaxID=1914329 RepID=UPI003F6BBA29
MTAKIVNLSRARKTRARDDKRRQADANAARFGQTKAERDAATRAAEAAARHLDQHKREDENE